VNVGGTLLLALVLFLTVYPLLMLLYGSVRSAAPGLPGALTLAGYADAYGDAVTYQTWANSLILATAVTLISTTIALCFAFTVARTDAPLRVLVLPLMTLIYIIPPIFFAFAWAMLGNPRAGLINVLAEEIVPGLGPLINVYSWPGLILVMAITTVPFKFLLLLGAFYAMDMSLEEASRVAGAGRWKTLVLVDLPVLAPTILGVMILGFVRSLQAFEIPLFLGFPAKIYVFSTRIYDYLANYFPTRYGEAGALSVTVVATLLVLVLIQWRALGRREFVTVTGKGYRPEVWRLGGLGCVFTALIVGYALLALLLPAIQLVLGSLTKIFGLYSAELFTLDNYQAALGSDVVRRGFVNTVLLAAGGGLLTMSLTVAIAYLIARTQYPLRKGLDLAVWVPWTLPGIVLGTAMLWAYLSVPGLKALYGTPWLLLIGVVVTVIPVGVRVMAGSLVQLSHDLEDSARIHGASWRQTFMTVVLPLVAPSFLYGWLVVAIIISGELSVPLLLYTPGSEVLSIAIFQLQSRAQPEVAAAVFTMVLAAAAVVIVLVRLVSLALDRLSRQRQRPLRLPADPSPALREGGP
jgi:iron(III) transport system permease protein